MVPPDAVIWAICGVVPFVSATQRFPLVDVTICPATTGAASVVTSPMAPVSSARLPAIPRRSSPGSGAAAPTRSVSLAQSKPEPGADVTNVHERTLPSSYAGQTFVWTEAARPPPRRNTVSTIPAPDARQGPSPSEDVSSFIDQPPCGSFGLFRFFWSCRLERMVGGLPRSSFGCIPGNLLLGACCDRPGRPSASGR